MPKKPGRPSRFSEPMRAEIGRRLAAGESMRSLAKEYRIAYSTIRTAFSDHIPIIKDVATRLAIAESAMEALPVSAQVSVRSLADQLKETSNHLARAAVAASRNAARLAEMASGQVDRVDSADPMETPEILQSISALGKLANDASQIPMALLNANKDLTAAKKPDVPIPSSLIIRRKTSGNNN